ncbi:hypothetical protein JCM16358_26230 [Halanaerocella petrolearia]
MNNISRKDILAMTKELVKMKKDWNQQGSEEDLEHLLQQLYLSIESALEDAAFYKALAEIAPDQFTREMFNEFAKDEREHAYQFRRAYERLTGDTYTSEYEYEVELAEDEYEEALVRSIREDTAEYKDYKNYYLMTNNPYLRDIFFNAMHDEMYHAVRELYLLQMMDMGLMSIIDL